MMKRLCILLACLLLLVISAPINAQSPTSDWQIPQIACDTDNCIRQDRVDEAGNLYVYVERFEPVRQEIVYVIERNSSQVTEYDLSNIHSTRGVLRDFVPFANGKLLIVEYQVPAPVTLVDLQTQQATSLDIDFVPWPCHDFMATIATRIQRVGQNGILFCSSGQDGRTLVLARLQDNTLYIEDTLAMGFPHRIESRVVPLWLTLTDGLDGKIYLMPFPDAPILSQVAPEYEGYDWSDYIVLRYDPATQQWDSVFIEAGSERWNAEGSFLVYMGTDPAGNFYLANSLGSETQPITDFVKYNPQGEKVWHLTEADFGLRRFKPLVVDENQFILDFGDYGQSDLEYAVQNESTDFLLVNENNTTLAPLMDNLAFDKNQFPTATAIRVDTAPEIVGSILFNLNGATTIDNDAPYTLPLPSTGTYTLTATPYADEDGQGKIGVPLSVTFEILDSAATPTPTHTPTPNPTSTPVVSNIGLQGEYFNKKDFTRLALTRIDPTIDFDWGRDSPAPEVQKNSFSVRWTGQVEPVYSETYTFYTLSDDGVRLWVNGQLLIDDWNNHSVKENSGTITLVAGQRYDIRMEYYEDGGNAVARLLWSSPSQAREVIPQSQLYPPEP